MKTASIMFCMIIAGWMTGCVRTPMPVSDAVVEPASAASVAVDPVTAPESVPEPVPEPVPAASSTTVVAPTPAMSSALPPAMPKPESVTFAQANDAHPTLPVSDGDRGPAVLRVQILLDRARFSPGQIDGAYGANTRRAIRGFQASRGLVVTGDLDAPTLAALDRDMAPVLVDMTLGADDVAGPFQAVPAGMRAKSKMKALGYSSPLEALGERFHASPGLLQQLNPGADFERAGEQLLVPNVNPTTPMPAVTSVVVSKSESTVSLLDASGRVVAQYPASTGSSHDPLPIGEWTITLVVTDPTFHYDPRLFWDAAPGEAGAILPPGPNNPVGLVWMQLSKAHYGIHGTPSPATIGKTRSHGCIRLTNWSALEMARVVGPGMPVTLKE